jgi:delta1-piperideine-2-carboxylate reductase
VAEDFERLSYPELARLLERIFLRAGVSERAAAVLSANCAACERDGSLSHGIFRIPGYVNSLRSGWVDGKAVPAIEEHGPNFLRIDARNGFAQVALDAARSRVERMAADTGAAVAAIRNSNHFSALWPDLEHFAAKGLVALSLVSGLACVVPPGGTAPVFGTNPIAFATPVAGAPPLIFDFATSAMSNGDLRIAARAGHRVPLGTGIDGAGNLSDDPRAILQGGALLPFGGHKGAALSLMVEILASAFTGGQFSAEVDFSSHPGAETPRTGQLLIVLDPARGGNAPFAARVAGLIETIRRSGEVRLPSDRRYRTRSGAERDGIPISREDHARLLALADPGIS